MHYVCAGDCGVEAKKPGVCYSDTCSSNGQELVACDCEDGLHEEVLGGTKKEKESESEEE